MRALFSVAAALALMSMCSAAYPSAGQIAFIEQDFYNMSDSNATNRTTAVVLAHGGRQFNALSLVAWNGAYSPNETNPLPAPDEGVLAFMHHLRAQSPGPLRLWGGIYLCPGRAYSCMLNYTQSKCVSCVEPHVSPLNVLFSAKIRSITGQQLAAVALAAGLDGVQIYVSPYCNNQQCSKTTGKYAKGIAAIIRSFREVAPALEISLLTNFEWDHGEIIVTGDPTVIFSFQTVFYFTNFGPCLEQAGSRCGAGENVAYTQQAGRNFTAILQDMTSSNVLWLGQLRGATTPEDQNPPDFWSALSGFAAGEYNASVSSELASALEAVDVGIDTKAA